ncbi:Exo-beta-D-glucosaminidase precursor [Planctomycetes bacterium CA13]|uniref:Beta-mannosidase B n=1 Tax=Novipirellula herctigrandis TaxID=2527986 RepID=A0A5C5YNE7_9BACT|nr:Exo-beta-D-glucosaminidase precursor [Planctomycetes bacterium CA13]
MNLLQTFRLADLVVSFFCIVATGALIADEPKSEQSPNPDSGRLVLDLSGQQWQMEGIRPGQGQIEGFHEYFGEVCPSTFNWNGAEVPGDVYTDLWRAGEIDDPHYGRNALRAKWVMEKEWWYRRQFGVPASWQGKTIHVCFEGVDYGCEVWLNGKSLGRHEGMFSPFEFEISEHLLYRDDRRANCLVLKLDPPPRSYRKVAGRKFAWHGDYWRTLTPIGIWKPVKIVATGDARITDVYPKTTIHDDGSATVDVQVSLYRENPDAFAELNVRSVIKGIGFESEPVEVEIAVPSDHVEGTVTLSMKVPDAKLWWPWELGDPNRYVVETTLIDSNGFLSDQSETKFGIREIRMQRNPGYSEEQVRNPWTFLINGKRLFMRSASWGGPPDIFYGRNSDEKYRQLIEMARDANLNNLRIFGWHPSEVDVFYDLCDELGVTVWQDLLPLASVRLPEDEAFREATFAEGVSMIMQLRHHPSLVMLEGGEEMFFGTQGLEYNADFLVGLGEAIRPFTDLPYVTTSPLDWPAMLHQRGLGGPKDSGHTHYLFYAMGGKLLEDYIAEWDFAVIPEFAISSAPNVDSIRKFIPPDEVWPPGPSWGFHWADLDTFIALNEQVVGDTQTDTLEHFVAATQVSQGVIFQWGIEHMRRRKPKSSAISICHFITFAPDMKWGIVDYFQEPKLSYDYVKRACQPLLVSIETKQRRWKSGETGEVNLWVVNDLDKTFEGCNIEAEVIDQKGNQIASNRFAVDEVNRDSSRKIDAFAWEVAGEVGDTFKVVARLIDKDGKQVSYNEVMLFVGDQEAARQQAQQRSQRYRDHKAKFPTADYYRFFPEYWGAERAKWFGGDNRLTPKATLD